MVNSFFRLASFRIFPGRCILCLGYTRITDDICHSCREDLPWLGPQCSRCAMPLANPSMCGQCLQSPPTFDECRAAWEYGYPVDQLISRFKYQGRRLEGELLSRLALDALLPHVKEKPDVIVPIPMHWRRRLQRGFNQADLIARHWSTALNIPLSSALYRQRYNPPQQGLSAKQRRRNLQSAFAIRECSRRLLPVHLQRPFQNKHVALVDDVVTTSATANSAAAILRKAGAERVSVWCLARTP